MRLLKVGAAVVAGLMLAAWTQAVMVVLPDGVRLNGTIEMGVIGNSKFAVSNGKLSCSGKFFVYDWFGPYTSNFTCTDGRSGVLSGDNVGLGVMTFSDGDAAPFATGTQIARLLVMAARKPAPQAPAQAEPKPKPEPKPEPEPADEAPERPLPPPDTSPPEFPLDPTGKAATEVTVALEADSGGIFTVPVFINKSVEVKFFVDSGASDIMLPSDVATTLWRNDALSDDDIYGEEVYRVASGKTTRAKIVILKELNVGGAKLRNVKASIGGDDTPLLLGQSFLKRFGAWSLDNQRHVLVLKAPAPAGKPKT